MPAEGVRWAACLACLISQRCLPGTGLWLLVMGPREILKVAPSCPTLGSQEAKSAGCFLPISNLIPVTSLRNGPESELAPFKRK